MCLLNPPAFTVLCVRCKRVTRSQQKELMAPRRQSAHSGDVAFSCTVISAGHSSYLGSRCINIVVPISLSLLPLLLQFYLSLLFTPSVPPPFSPFLCLYANALLLLWFPLTISCFLPLLSFPCSYTHLHLLSASGLKTQSFIHLYPLPFLCVLFILVNTKLPAGKKFYMVSHL